MLLTDSRQESVDKRLQHYSDFTASTGPIKAYINVGGGVASLGGEDGRAQFRGGLNQVSSTDVADISCVMSRYAQQGMPVIHLGDVKQLAQAFELPVAPEAMPAVGAGRVQRGAGTGE